MKKLDEQKAGIERLGLSQEQESKIFMFFILLQHKIYMFKKLFFLIYYQNSISLIRFQFHEPNCYEK